ncbi:MAG: family 20 glycosylhydrolase [Armatimonadetes bacterium]|nr:family 20 glycosylhydrolase [Armatimonadota bacterium]MDE2206007.1 family 20 glycosylhydrolase [Armatimonadota bacterium]
MRLPVSVQTTDRRLIPLARVLSGELERGFGMPSRVSPRISGSGVICLRLVSGMARDSYSIRTTDRVVVSAGTYDDVAEGTVTVLQALMRVGHGLLAPRMQVTDFPGTRYRGLMLDVARKYHTIDCIKQCVELCRFYKVRFLRLHLSDDHLFMFPSAAFPQLGRSNAEFVRFDPPSRDGPIPPYTAQQLEGLERYSRDRGVAIVPEIDVPGHAGRMVSDAPDIFGVPGGGSSTVDIASRKTEAAVITLMNEEMAIFRSSPYISVGGDEAWLGGLEKAPGFASAIRRAHVRSPEGLYRKFIVDLNLAANAHKKQMLVYEEAWRPGLSYALPLDAICVEWTLDSNPENMLRSGAQVVNGSWTPLYIVRENKRSARFIYHWSVNQFGYQPPYFQGKWITAQTGPRLLGAEMLSWENPDCAEIQALRTRLAAMAERLWASNQPARTYHAFRSRLAHTDRLLERLIHNVTIRGSGTFRGDENRFQGRLVIRMTNRIPGSVTRYNLNNRLPTAASKVYTQPLTITHSVWVRAAAFTSAGRRIGPVSGAWYHAVASGSPG